MDIAMGGVHGPLSGLEKAAARYGWKRCTVMMMMQA